MKSYLYIRIIYKNTYFRYGFIHTEALPRDFDENEKKEKEIERQRAVKWAKMHKNFNKSSIREKLRRRIFKGIPDSMRGSSLNILHVFCLLFNINFTGGIWQKLLGIEEKKEDNRNMYKKMLMIGHKYSTDIRQIDNDINR